MVATSSVQVLIGTHTWSPSNGDKIDQIVQTMRNHGVKGLDTARVYLGGDSEKAIGAKNLSNEFFIDTKAATAVFRTYLLHGPDETVPIEEQIDAIQRLYVKGHFERLGLSNFTKDQFIEYWNAAAKKDCLLPTVYQSNYSIAGRRNETELFPTLREHRISIQAYSPMAAGLLSKTAEYIEEGKGQWNPDLPTGKILRDMYFKPSYMKMLRDFGKLSEESSVSRMGLAYRWVKYHSMLDGKYGDEMIIGGTDAQHVEDGLVEMEKGPLEPWVVERINHLWETIKDDAPVDNLKSFRKVARAVA